MTKIPVAILLEWRRWQLSLFLSLLEMSRRTETSPGCLGEIILYNMSSSFLFCCCCCCWLLMTARPKQKQTLERESVTGWNSNGHYPKCLFGSLHHVLVKGPGMIHPPAGPTSSRIREGKEKKKRKKIWERKSSENKKTKESLDGTTPRLDDEGLWSRHTHNPSMAHLLLLKKKKYFGTTIHQHPLLPTLWTRNIFRWSSRKRWLNRSLSWYLFFSKFFFFFFFTFLCCCINSFPSCVTSSHI